MAEPRTEGAVVDRTSDLQQQVGPASRPSHLLGLVHTTIDQEVRCAFRNRSPDAQAGTISFGVIDEPAALVAEIIVDLVQRARHSLRDGTPVVRWPRSPLKTCRTLWTRSMVRRALLALPFQISQRRRSTCSMMTVF